MLELTALKTLLALRVCFPLPYAVDLGFLRLALFFTEASLSHRLTWPLHFLLETTGQPSSPLTIAKAVLVSIYFLINRKQMATFQGPPREDSAIKFS